MAKEVKKISTKDVPTTGLSKTISPGENIVKINSVKLQRFPFMETDQGYYLVLDVETAPIPDFEGFFLDKDDESKGKYEGQVGQVKTNRYFYKDGETKSGIKTNRDMDILKQIRNICVATDSIDWFTAADGKYETIEEIIEAFNTAAPFKDKYLRMCVAGKEFARDNGFIGYDLFLPKMERNKVAYEAVDAKPSKLITYDETKHLIKIESKAVSSFGEGTNLPTDIPDLSGAPEFEI